MNTADSSPTRLENINIHQITVAKIPFFYLFPSLVAERDATAAAYSVESGLPPQHSSRLPCRLLRHLMQHFLRIKGIIGTNRLRPLIHRHRYRRSTRQCEHIGTLRHMKEIVPFP